MSRSVEFQVFHRKIQVLHLKNSSLLERHHHWKNLKYDEKETINWRVFVRILAWRRRKYKSIVSRIVNIECLGETSWNCDEYETSSNGYGCSWTSQRFSTSNYGTHIWSSITKSFRKTELASLWRRTCSFEKISNEILLSNISILFRWWQWMIRPYLVNIRYRHVVVVCEISA